VSILFARRLFSAKALCLLANVLQWNWTFHCYEFCYIKILCIFSLKNYFAIWEVTKQRKLNVIETLLASVFEVINSLCVIGYLHCSDVALKWHTTPNIRIVSEISKLGFPALCASIPSHCSRASLVFSFYFHPRIAKSNTK
jgi:hypothetical protein